MSLIDDAVSTAVHRIMELDGLDDLSSSGVEAVIHNHLLEQLTADGPVILLPDRREGPKAAKPDLVRTRLTTEHTGIGTIYIYDAWGYVLRAAREVAE